MDNLMAEWKHLDVNAPKPQGRGQAPQGAYDFQYPPGSGNNSMSYFNYPHVGGTASVGSSNGTGTDGRVGGPPFATGGGGARLTSQHLEGTAAADAGAQQGGGVNAHRIDASAPGTHRKADTTGYCAVDAFLTDVI
jgi:hypothetical protein